MPNTGLCAIRLRFYVCYILVVFWRLGAGLEAHHEQRVPQRVPHSQLGGGACHDSSRIWGRHLDRSILKRARRASAARATLL